MASLGGSSEWLQQLQGAQCLATSRLCACPVRVSLALLRLSGDENDPHLNSRRCREIPKGLERRHPHGRKRRLSTRSYRCHGRSSERDQTPRRVLFRRAHPNRHDCLPFLDIYCAFEGLSKSGLRFLGFGFGLIGSLFGPLTVGFVAPTFHRALAISIPLNRARCTEADGYPAAHPGKINIDIQNAIKLLI
jgi:hypothetical protein